jgi:hypothetical protein
MELSGNCRTESQKFSIMIHELGHRLLGGNSLGIIKLGLTPPGEKGAEYTDYEVEIQHRHLYLFVYDLVRENFGEERAQAYERFESYPRRGRKPDDPPDPHALAWKWAMSLTPQQRRQATKRLVSHALPRDRWGSVKVVPRDPDQWFAYLTDGKPPDSS